MAKFATETVWVIVLRGIFIRSASQKFDLIASGPHRNKLEQLLGLVYTILELHKHNSKLFLKEIGA